MHIVTFRPRVGVIFDCPQNNPCDIIITSQMAVSEIANNYNNNVHYLPIVTLFLSGPSYPPSQASLLSFVMWGAAVLVEWLSLGRYLNLLWTVMG